MLYQVTRVERSSKRTNFNERVVGIIPEKAVREEGYNGVDWGHVQYPYTVTIGEPISAGPREAHKRTFVAAENDWYNSFQMTNQLMGTYESIPIEITPAMLKNRYG